jgi:hypothetical protein
MFGHLGRNINSVLTCTIGAILHRADGPICRLHDADQYITAVKIPQCAFVFTLHYYSAISVYTFPICVGISYSRVSFNSSGSSVAFGDMMGAGVSSVW